MIEAGMSSASQVVVCLLAVAIVAPAVGRAQVSAREREAAAQAYDRGTAAHLAGNHERAAQWFETAHRLAPAAAALVQSVRSYGRSGNTMRAATLALRLQVLYPNHSAASRTMERALRHAGDFVRVDVECDEECTIEVGGSLMGHTSFFLDPGADHEVTAEFETGNRVETVSGAPGETVLLSFEAPEPQAEVSGEPSGPSPVDPTDEGDGGGVPLAVTFTALGVTAAVGGVLIWSGIDTLDGVPAYENAATMGSSDAAILLEDGRGREERTNWLIASTSVAAAVSAVFLALTDWGGGASSDGDEGGGEVEAEALLEVQRSGVLAGLRGRF